jgi:hypothetical protein
MLIKEIPITVSTENQSMVGTGRLWRFRDLGTPWRKEVFRLFGERRMGMQFCLNQSYGAVAIRAFNLI